MRRSSRLSAAENLTLTLEQPGQVDTLRYVSCSREAPGRGEVEIEVCAVGLNFKEVLYATGLLPEAESLGNRFGLECAGRISRVGEGVREDVQAMRSLPMRQGACSPTPLCPRRRRFRFRLG